MSGLFFACARQVILVEDQNESYVKTESGPKLIIARYVDFFNYFYFIITTFIVKKAAFILFIFFFSFSFAQQNEEFKAVKKFYDYQRSILNKEFKKQFEREAGTAAQVSIQKDFEEFMVKLDSIQNTAMLYALIRTKTKEDLYQLKLVPQNEQKNPPRAELTKNADYPGGFNSMRQQIVDLFYAEGLLPEQKIMKAHLLFVVEKDGSISSVKAEGENFNFNRQAEIALYLLPERFTPAYTNGIPVRYRFRLPLSINFE